MRVVCDIEANSLRNPSKIWLIVCKDIDTEELHIFRHPIDGAAFLEFARRVSLWIGHNFLEYDYPNMERLLGLNVEDIADKTIDTLILSRLVDYSRPTGHSLESYGEEFNVPKLDYSDWTKFTPEMEEYCKRDVDITHRTYLKYGRVVQSSDWRPAILNEQRFQLVVNDIQRNGFSFNSNRANTLLADVNEELEALDKEILSAFPPKLKLIREIHPKETKHGTLSRTDFRWVSDGDLSAYNGGPFCRCSWERFNPSSHKQIIDVLHAAGWMPVDKTATHLETEREITRCKRERRHQDLPPLEEKLTKLSKYGWRVNEDNLNTLPDTAPAPARSLAKRITIESRRRTLTEWLGLVQEDDRIHGKFLGIGTWTHRTATQAPNMQNIPNEFDTNGKVKYLGKELRQLWRAPRNRLLAGVDAEGIQLRIFAHYIDDKEFTDALVSGRKGNKTDPHSLNQRVLGRVCRTRQAAKRFVYALLLGGGMAKLAQILECSVPAAQEALDRLLERYTGFKRLKEEVIQVDAKKGYFTGLDGRRVRIPGDTVGERRHLCMSGYLQNGEAIVMKLATLEWYNRLNLLRSDYPKLNWKLVNLVHDEWQTEVNNNMDLALLVAKEQSDSLRVVGERLKLKCPLAGSYWNDDHQDYTIGTNWYQTH